MAEKNVRVRIAPSPTGDPHVGTGYCALFNYAFAKKHGGKFILRIEDTDQERTKASSEEQIFSTLRWLGLDWDEGPDIGGKYGPYRQSERKELYLQYIQFLLDNGRAYHCFCSKERLAEVREQQKSQGLTTKYDGHCRGLDQREVAERIAAGEQYVIRLRMPDEGECQFDDHLRGSISIKYSQLDDQVLLKADGMPTYHFANVVDDHLMAITHVIRAEEWISSTPKHKVLYDAFGWEEPVWVHLPLIRNSDRSKISKRKNPVSLSYYKQAGVLPEALVNFLALMGWHIGDDQEIFSLDEMVASFDMKKMSLGGPVFDLTKLGWLNQHYIKEMSPEAFADFLREEMFSDAFLRTLQPLFAERLTQMDQFVDKAGFFFSGALDYQAVALEPAKRDVSETKKALKGLVERLDDVYEWRTESLESVVKTYKDELGWKPKEIFMLLRLVLTGRKDSPPLFDCMELLGRERVRFRLRDAYRSL